MSWLYSLLLFTQKCLLIPARCQALCCHRIKTKNSTDFTGTVTYSRSLYVMCSIITVHLRDNSRDLCFLPLVVSYQICLGFRYIDFVYTQINYHCFEKNHCKMLEKLLEFKFSLSIYLYQASLPSEGICLLLRYSPYLIIIFKYLND